MVEEVDQFDSSQHRHELAMFDWSSLYDSIINELEICYLDL